MNKKARNIYVYIFKRLLILLFSVAIFLTSIAALNTNKIKADDPDTYDLTITKQTIDNIPGEFDFKIKFWKEETPTQEGTITLNVNFVHLSGNSPATLSSNPDSYDYTNEFKYVLYKGDTIDTATQVEVTSVFPKEGWTYDSTSNSFSYEFKNIEENQNYIIGPVRYGSDGNETVGCFKTENPDNTGTKIQITIYPMFDWVDTFEYTHYQSAQANGSVSFTHDVEDERVLALPNNNILNALTDLFIVNKVYAEDNKVTITPYDPDNTDLPSNCNISKVADGEYSFTLTNGQSAIFENLPHGVKYEVYEETQHGWKLVDINGSESFSVNNGTGGTSGTLEENTEITFNNMSVYDIEVNKIVTGINGDKNKEFEFTVKVSGWKTIWSRTITGLIPDDIADYRYIGLEFDDPIGATYLTDIFGNETITLSNKYRIASTKNTPFLNMSLEGIEWTDPWLNVGEGNADLNDNGLGLIDTYYDDVHVAVGDIVEIQEYVDLDLSPYGGVSNGDGSYTFKLKDGGKFTLEDIPNGYEYVISEKDYSSDNYSTTVDEIEASSVSGIITENESHTFINELTDVSSTHNLTIYKETVDNAEGLFNYELTLKDVNDTPIVNRTFGSGASAVTTDDEGKIRFSLSNGESKTISSIPNDTKYEVYELDNENNIVALDEEFNGNWKLIAQNNNIGIIHSNVSVRFKNQKSNTLTVKKETIDNKEGEFNFKIDFKKHTVLDDSRLTPNGTSGRVSGLQSITPGSFIYRYLYRGDDYIYVTKDGATENDYPDNTWTIESSLFDSYDVENIEHRNRTLVITLKDGSKYRDINADMNRHSAGTDVLSYDYVPSFSFTLNNGESIEIKDIPQGRTYEVYELNTYNRKVNVGENVRNLWTLESQENESGELSKDTIATFVNRYGLSDLTIKKVTEGDAEGDFDFVVKAYSEDKVIVSGGRRWYTSADFSTNVPLLNKTLMLTAKTIVLEKAGYRSVVISGVNDSMVINGVPDENGYYSKKVWEDENGNYLMLFAKENGDINISGYIPEKAERIYFESIEIKTDDDDYMDLSAYGVLTENEGEYKISVSSGESVVLKDIPNNHNYEVYELKSNGTKAKEGEYIGRGWGLKTSTNSIGTITKDTTTVFTNEEREPEVVIVDPPIKKTVDGENRNDPFIFTMEAVSNTAGIEVKDMPMPEGSVEGKKQVVINGGKEFEFGEFTITQPGTYVYSMKEKSNRIPGYTYDNSTYTVTYVVTVNDDNELEAKRTIEKDGEVVDDVVFINKFVPEKPDDTPKKPYNYSVPKTGIE